MSAVPQDDYVMDNFTAPGITVSVLGTGVTDRTSNGVSEKVVSDRLMVDVFVDDALTFEATFTNELYQTVILTTPRGRVTFHISPDQQAQARKAFTKLALKVSE